MKSKIINISIIIMSALILIGYVVFVDGVENIVKVWSTAIPTWLGLAVLAMVLYWLLEAFALHIVTKKLNPNHTFKATFKTTMIGQLFNCITPFASGGQPVQAYHMTKCGMPIGLASSALLAKFIVYQTILCIYSFLVLIFQYSFFAESIKGFGVLVFIGFAINTVVVVGLICLGFFPRITSKFCYCITKFLSKIRIVKNYDKTIEKVNNETKGFYESFQLLKRHKLLILKMSLVTVVELTMFFLIPYFICLSFGLFGSDVIKVISAGACVLMISSFVPLPGAAGGAEGSFYMFFHMLIPGNYMSMIILIWRLITFYMPIMVGSIFSMGFTKQYEQGIKNTK